MSKSQPTDNEVFEGIIAAAIEAGKVVHDIYRGQIDVSHKADASPVTNADHAAEAIILARLGEVAPHIPIIAEEEVAARRVPAGWNEVFLAAPRHRPQGI